MLVLTSGAWPGQPAPAPFTAPSGVAQAQQLFASFYATLFGSGRRLTWLYALSKAEVRAHCWSRRYELVCNAFQLAALLLLNEHAQLSVADFAAASSLPTPLALATLQSLVDDTLLLVVDDVDTRRQQQAEAKQEKQALVATSRVAVNERFASKRLRLQIGAVASRDTVEETTQTHESVNADRQVYLQATIVRVMKTRKRLAHTELVAEVIAQVRRRRCRRRSVARRRRLCATQAASRFRVAVPLIKKCIGTLIEKEYLTRDAADARYYNYVA